MIEFLVWLLVACIVFGLVYYVITLIPLPPPFKNIAVIILVLIFVLILLWALVGFAPPLLPRH